LPPAAGIRGETTRTFTVAGGPLALDSPLPHVVIVSAQATGHTASAPPRWSPALRLLVDRARAIAWRPGAIGVALLARGLGRRAYPVWPSTRHPRIAADIGHPAAAAWLQRTFEPDSPQRRGVGPATWSAVRARGLVAGPPSRLVSEAVLQTTARDVAGLRLALYSATGQSLSKAACFVFEHGAEEPALVVKVMPEPAYADRLRHETEIIESFRGRLGPASAAAEALPLRPLFTGTAATDYVVVQAVDPLAAGTGLLARPADALAWLHEFQGGTTTAVRPWSGSDTEAALEPVRYAWQRARPKSTAAVILRVGRLLNDLEGQPVPRCGVHGDFWRDNIAQIGGRLRVYDWEWAQPEGVPFFDLWTSELGMLRRQAEEGRPRLLEGLREALARVASELDRRALDARFALATLAPSLGEIVFRVRRATGVPGGAEAESVRVMGAAEALLE
jgi:hypothetical protein